MRAHFAALAKRGDAVWREVEGEIEKRNQAGYERASKLLHDLQMLAVEKGTADNFRKHLKGIRERHARKMQFITRISGLG